jgi:hypothetical protein
MPNIWFPAPSPSVASFAPARAAVLKICGRQPERQEVSRKTSVPINPLDQIFPKEAILIIHVLGALQP